MQLKPQKDLFFIAYYGITDSFIIFFFKPVYPWFL